MTECYSDEKGQLEAQDKSQVLLYRVDTNQGAMEHVDQVQLTR